MNLASRLESLTKQYGVGILVSDETMRDQTAFVFRELDVVKVKGKAKPVRIFELVCRREIADEQLLQEITAFESALSSYRLRDWQAAQEKLRVLQRKQELETIGTQMAALETQIAGLDSSRQANEQRLQALETTRQEIVGNVAQQQRLYAELRSKLSGFEVQIEQYKARKERAENELAEVVQQSETEQENLSAARVILQESIEKMEADTVQREELIVQRDQCRAQLDQTRQTARHDRDLGQELRVRESSLKTQLTSIREGIGRCVDGFIGQRFSTSQGG